MRRVRARFKKLAISARVVERRGQNNSGTAEHPNVTPAANNESTLRSCTPPTVSPNPAGAASPKPNARTRKLAICARVVERRGQNNSGTAEHPNVTPNTANRST